jgi:hypothetical protein
MSIRDARKNMGCATKREGEDLVVATYGEWDSHIEGGAFMLVLAVVPEGVEVESRKGLSGTGSAAREWHSNYLSKPANAKGGYWYGPASPGPRLSGDRMGNRRTGTGSRAHCRIPDRRRRGRARGVIAVLDRRGLQSSEIAGPLPPL